MKVKELIEQLQQYNPETLVLIPGYEGGYEDVKRIEKIGVVLNYNKESYYGPHELIDNIIDKSKLQTLPITKALVIS